MRALILIALIGLAGCNGRTTSESGMSEAAVTNQAAAIQKTANENVNAAIAKIEADTPPAPPVGNSSDKK
jgi:hypothetical protein